MSQRRGKTEGYFGLTAFARAATLAGLLAGCGPRTDVAHNAAPSAAVPTTSTAATSAATSPRPTATASAASVAPTSAFSAQQIQSLTEQLRDRRVFRHLILGKMPAERQRHSWLLSKDGRRLTLTCELGDPGMIESGPPDPKRWYLVASASFVATDLPPGQTWARHYQREQLVALARLPKTDCSGVGEQLALECRPEKLQLLGPNAYVPAETHGEAPIRWKPSARHPVAGLSCRVTAGKAGEFEFALYDFPKNATRPMLFFSNDRRRIERLVYLDSLQYADFREAVLTPFDGLLPPHLREHAP